MLLLTRGSDKVAGSNRQSTGKGTAGLIIMVTGRSHDIVTEDVSLAGNLLFLVGLLPTVTVNIYRTLQPIF